MESDPFGLLESNGVTPLVYWKAMESDPFGL